MKQKRASTGFTLIELMVVVGVIAILATVALVSYRRYSEKAYDAEATSVLADIRIKQEAYRATFHQYFDAREWLPDGSPGREGRNWPGNDAWRMAGLNPDNGLYFSYFVAAGAPGEDPPEPFDDVGLDSANDFWFAAQALQDLDGNGKCAGFEIYAGKAEIVPLAEGEVDCP